MALYQVTATFTVDTVTAGLGQIRAEANVLLGDLARRVSDSGSRVEYDAEALQVTRLPDPPRTVTMTEDELAAHIQACVAQALAELDAVASAE